MATPAAAVSTDPPHLTVMIFRSTEQGLGAHAADVLRNRLAHDFSERQLATLPTDIVKRALQQSGFAPNEPLDPSNEQLLARLVHAEYYITGVISHTSSGYHLLPRLVLAHDTALTQPLPETSGPTLDAAITPVATALRNAMQQLSGAQQCMAAAHGGNTQAAITAAQAGIVAYPQATLVRLCELDVYWGALYPRATTRADSMRYADSALAVSRAIVATDPTSMQPLKAEAELYAVTGDSAQARQALLSLVRVDPHNIALKNQVVNSLAAQHDTADAVQLVQDLLTEGSRDPQVRRTAFLVYLFAHQWQSATTLGPQLIMADTAAADTTYFMHMARAYRAQNESHQAIAVLRQGTVKFPNNADLWQLYSQDLRQAGQIPQADTALKRAIALNPQMSVGLLQLAEVYQTNHQPDSAYATLQHVATIPGADRPLIAQTALAQGGHLYQSATASANRVEYQHAFRFLQLSNQIAPSTDAQFLASAASFAIMQSAAREAHDTKSCALAHLAQQAAGDVPAGLTAGAHDPKYQTPAAQMMEVLPQLHRAIDEEITKFCR